MIRVGRKWKHLLTFPACVYCLVLLLQLSENRWRMNDHSAVRDCCAEQTEEMSLKGGIDAGTLGLLDYAVVYRHIPPPAKFEDIKFARKFSLPIPVTDHKGNLGLPAGLPPHFRVSGQLSDTEIDLRALVSLVKITTTITFKCIKFLKQGGRTCQRTPDGDKKFCVDEHVAPPTRPCIVYSIGIGHDFSFDRAMGSYGCDVFSFDDDSYHDLYGTNPFPRVHFAHIRLGKSILWDTEINNLKNTTFEFLYRPLDNIMYILHHEKSNIDFLKLDIEGQEWEVFEESIFKMDILERTRQLAIEIHMEKFAEKDLAPRALNEAIGKYLRFFEGLQERGFQLAHYEPNYMGDEGVVTVGGITFTAWAEQLWVNTRVREGSPPSYKRPIDFYVNMLEY
ncbi:uncharacterized protein LOC122248896 isoform X1 [Penaeus japonicus]|uniref:uncharacterized protein LOC122248896 isoform X1 n=1 Tax=Penaeus japonicus TaxID=27405 RepID=UPI001C70E420|nr:uncharacterized protein LOC122248896 isoform X1 [Penaeus japonicus]XP_042865199.1 uncharacterized protein LOC122248896 isoform X1 [Penaeus japonicus]